MKRGEVYDARLDPVEGSEQGGTRPVIIVSREAINISSTLVIAIPCTTYRVTRRLYPSQILIQSPNGGFDRDTIALGEQLRAISKTRLLKKRGTINPQTLIQLEQALLMTLDLAE